ncbi:MAG: endonuclease/exonuclease/phosphatase family protein [Acidobacteriota bacterium]
MSEVRVATYNIRSGEGIDGRVDIARIARVIGDMDVDIIGLQEVDRNWRRSQNIYQARYLAKALGMHYVYGPALTRGSAQYGNAVLSRYPILSSQVHPLASYRENRAVLQAVIDVSGHILNFTVTHLGLSLQERLWHIRDIIKPLLITDDPLVLVGDFNCDPRSPEVLEFENLLIEAFPKSGYFTFSSDKPDQRIDYIMHNRLLKTVSVEVIESQASDHLPLAALLAFTG